MGVNNEKADVGLLLVINVLSIIGLSKIRINTDFDIFILNNSPKKDIYETMKNDFSASEDMLVMMEFDTNTMATKELNKIFSFEDYLKDNKSISFVNTFIPEKIQIDGKTVFILVETDKNPMEPEYAERILGFEEDLKATTYTEKNC